MPTTSPEVSTPSDTITEATNSIVTVPSSNESNNTIENTTSPMSKIASRVIQHENTLAVSHISVTITSTNEVSSFSTSTSRVVISSTSASSIQQSTTTLLTSTSVFNKIPDNTKIVSDNKIRPTSDDGQGLEKEANSDGHHLCGNADCSHSKVAGLVVACLLVALLLIIVILVVVKKSWNHHRSRKYKRIDYLIDGMYS